MKSFRLLGACAVLSIPSAAIAQNTKVGPSHGTVLVVGGGSLGPEVLGKFIELAGGPDAVIIDVPTAGGDSVYPADWQTIRKVTPDGFVATIGGATSANPRTSDGIGGAARGSA